MNGYILVETLIKWHIIQLFKLWVNYNKPSSRFKKQKVGEKTQQVAQIYLGYIYLQIYLGFTISNLYIPENFHTVNIWE